MLVAAVGSSNVGWLQGESSSRDHSRQQHRAPVREVGVVAARVEGEKRCDFPLTHHSKRNTIPSKMPKLVKCGEKWGGIL